MQERAVHAVFIGCWSLAFAASVAVYRLHGRSKAGRGQAVGELESYRGAVQVRELAVPIWTYAASRQSLYSNSVIATGSAGSATIRFDDGRALSLAADTMLVLRREESAQAADLVVTLVNGTVATEVTKEVPKEAARLRGSSRPAVNKPTKLVLRAKDQSLTVKDSQTALTLTKSRGETAAPVVKVTSGAAEWLDQSSARRAVLAATPASVPAGAPPATGKNATGAARAAATGLATGAATGPATGAATGPAMGPAQPSTEPVTSPTGEMNLVAATQAPNLERLTINANMASRLRDPVRLQAALNKIDTSPKPVVDAPAPAGTLRLATPMLPGLALAAKVPPPLTPPDAASDLQKKPPPKLAAIPKSDLGALPSPPPYLSVWTAESLTGAKGLAAKGPVQVTLKAASGSATANAQSVVLRLGNGGEGAPVPVSRNLEATIEPAVLARQARNVTRGGAAVKGHVVELKVTFAGGAAAPANAPRGRLWLASFADQGASPLVLRLGTPRSPSHAATWLTEDLRLDGSRATWSVFLEHGSSLARLWPLAANAEAFAVGAASAASDTDFHVVRAGAIIASVNGKPPSSEALSGLSVALDGDFAFSGQSAALVKGFRRGSVTNRELLLKSPLPEQIYVLQGNKLIMVESRLLRTVPKTLDFLSSHGDALFRESVQVRAVK